MIPKMRKAMMGEHGLVPSSFYLFGVSHHHPMNDLAGELFIELLEYHGVEVVD